MAFNISEFHSQISRFGGVAKASLFEVLVTPPLALRTAITGDELRFFCQSTTIPGFELGVTDYLAQGYGRAEKRITNIQFDAFQAIFVVDAEYRVKQFFDEWVFLSVNYDNRIETRPTMGKEPYEIEYRNNIYGTVTVQSYGSNNSPRANYIYQFAKAYPTNVGSVEMAWASTNEYLRLPVSFAFSSYTHSGLSSGPPVQIPII